MFRVRFTGATLLAIGLVFVATASSVAQAPNVDALVQQLKNPDPLRRVEAAFQLGRLGNGAKVALPALQEALRDVDPDVRAVVANALRRIADAPADPAPAPAGGAAFKNGRAEIVGKLSADDPPDRERPAGHKAFDVPLVKGKFYVVDLTSSDFDTYLRIEQGGATIAKNDDGGEGTNSRLRYSPPESGTFRFVVTAFFANRAGDFRLTIREEGVAVPEPLATKVEPNGVDVGGRLEPDDPIDPVRRNPAKRYDVTLVAGDTYVIDMMSPRIDSYLRLEAPNGQQVAFNDDGGEGLNARIVYRADVTGKYTIVATSFGRIPGGFTLRVTRQGAGGVPPGKVADPRLPVVGRLIVSRTVLSHGRLDDVRAAGYASPENPGGQPNAALDVLFKTIAAQPNPNRVTMDVNDQANGPRDPANPSPVLVAAGPIPSGVTLLVAELGDPALGQSVVRWDQALPRFGAGNYYATVSFPAANIVAGQELVTKEHFDAYLANSILWEAPDFGNLVVARNLEGGTTNLGVVLARGVKQAPLGFQVGWANPLELELAEVSQTRQKDPAGIRVLVQATLPNSFEATPRIRWAAETNKTTVLGETALGTGPGRRTAVFAIDLPADTEGSVKISAVASPGPFVRAIGDVQKEARVAMTTFHSRGSTLEDTLSVQIKKSDDDLAKDIQQKLDEAKAKTGDVQVSLYWQSKDDLDLRVVAPSGEEIFYGSRTSRCGGHLDVDMNVSYNSAKAGAVENVFWPQGKAPAGKYKVYVDHYSHHGGQPGTLASAPFNVRVVIQGRTEVFGGTVVSGDPKRRRVLVHEFEVK